MKIATVLTRELVLGLLLLGIGAMALPLAVYWVGQQVVGEYGTGGGPFDLLNDLWTALARAEAAAWLLVLSPYVVWQLARLTVRIWRARKPPVTGVTVSDRDGRAA